MFSFKIYTYSIINSISTECLHITAISMKYTKELMCLPSRAEKRAKELTITPMLSVVRGVSLLPHTVLQSITELNPCGVNVSSYSLLLNECPLSCT